MKRLSIGGAAAVALALCSAAAAAPRPASQETTIPYANRDGILDWKVAGPDTLYLRDMMGRWYLVRTAAPCPRLRSATALGFITVGTDRLDRFSTIVAEGWRCQIDSITRAAAPSRAVAKKG